MGRLNYGALGVAALPDGTSWLIGTFENTVVFGQGEATETTLNAASSFYYDVFLAHYAPDGSLSWARRLGDVGYDVGHHVAVRGDGTAIVTGYFEGALAADAPLDPPVVSSGAQDVFVAAYSREGALQWAKASWRAR